MPIRGNASVSFGSYELGLHVIVMKHSVKFAVTIFDTAGQSAEGLRCCIVHAIS